MGGRVGLWREGTQTNQQTKIQTDNEKIRQRKGVGSVYTEG